MLNSVPANLQLLLKVILASAVISVGINRLGQLIVLEPNATLALGLVLLPTIAVGLLLWWRS